MNLEDIVPRIDDLEEKIRGLNNAVLSVSNQAKDVDERTSNFISMIREDKKDIARLNTTVMGLGTFDGAINQVRTDFNRKIEEIQIQRKQEDQIRSNVLSEDLKNMLALIEKTKIDILNDIEKKLVFFREENTRLVNRAKEIEERSKESILKTEEFRTSISSIRQDLRRTIKQVENLQSDQDIYRSSQNEVRVQLETITDTLRTNESRLNEIIATESERRQNQLDFMEKITVVSSDKERTWQSWEQQIDHLVRQVSSTLPELQQQQFTMKQTKEDVEEISEQLQRRTNEITEMYRLMDEKFRKEWETFKSDSEKRWANVSMVLDDKRDGQAEKLQAIQERMVFVEDNNHEMQEVLLLMSSEIQKGMQNIMKMVNGWMDAFSQIKTSDKK